MKLLLDGRNISRSGIGSYTKMLIYGLLNNKGIDLVVMGQPEEFGIFKDKVKILEVSNSIYSITEQLSTILAEIRVGNLDLVHYTNYNKSLLSKFPYIVTIHDLIQFKFHYGNALKLSIAKSLFYNSISNARKIICVSNSTKVDLLSMFPNINQKKICVVYNPAVNPLMSYVDNVDVKGKYGLDWYILYVGNRKPHKNLLSLVRAIKILKEKYSDIKLVVIGKRFETSDNVDMEVKSLGLEDKILMLENVPYDELVSFYRNAELTILPSLDEGFGFVPFESISQGTLPLVSDIPIMRELFFDEKEIFFDPYSHESIAKKIDEFLSSVDDRQKVLYKLSKYLDIYSYDRFINGTIQVYQDAMNI